MLAAFFAVLYVDKLFDTDICIGLVTLFIGSVGLLEFCKIVKNDETTPFKIPGLICGIAIFLSVWFSARGSIADLDESLIPGILVALIFLAFFAQGIKGSLPDALRNISITIFGVLYVFFLISYTMSVYHLPGGNGVFDFLFVVLVSKVADIGGYLVGRKFGKHKMSPVISPKKSIEGLIAGLLMSVGVAWGMCLVADTWIISWQLLTPFALLVGFSGVLGDLAESMIKRGADVKDAGSVVPTFGGVLDIIDSLLVSMPVAYYFLFFVRN